LIDGAAMAIRERQLPKTHEYLHNDQRVTDLKHVNPLYQTNHLADFSLPALFSIRPENRKKTLGQDPSAFATPRTPGLPPAV